MSIQNNFHVLFLNFKVKLEKHASQKDYSTGFGGKYGVQEGSKDKVRSCCTSSLNILIPNVSSSYILLIFYSQYWIPYLQSALGWDHIEKVEKHDSQKDYKTGFGGKFGVQQGSMDKSALGWEHVEKVEKHESQKGEIKQRQNKILKMSNPIFQNRILPEISKIIHISILIKS